MDREALGELFRKFPVYPEAFNLDDDSEIIGSYYEELNGKHWDKEALEAHIERWRVIWGIDAADVKNPKLHPAELALVQKTYNIDEVYPCFVAGMSKDNDEEYNAMLAKYGGENMKIAGCIIMPRFLYFIKSLAEERGVYDKVIYIQAGKLEEMF